ncbi:glycine cleavage system aminomethyltransferase GcvT [Chlamydiales bacterium]|nr:glycine cleavage system aminomethyltransferase GcvT [Chlamydiales bacterium]
MNKKTFLYQKHLDLGAKMVPFSGWEMPIYYSSLIKEHEAVRKEAGLFDVSHMGIIEVKGEKAREFLEWISTNTLTKPVTYTLLCNESGGTIDDLICYKKNEHHFLVIVNAGNREKDLAHLKAHSGDVEINLLEGYGILALQGPKAATYLSIPEMKPRTFLESGDLFIATTGYTGERGFEIYGKNEVLAPLFDDLMNKGVTPCGLGCRDSLRLEMGYALYGHEISETISPMESVASWAVKLDKEFYGKEALSKKRSMVGLTLLERAVPREGYKLFINNLEVGMITSGTFSPSMQRGIALALVNEPLSVGEKIEVSIRNKRCPAVITTLPFLER